MLFRSLTEYGVISALLDESDALPAHCDIVDVGGRYLVPGFIDTQVNGGGGVLFNDAPTVEGIRAIAAAHRRFGSTSLLPTLISDELSTVDRALTAVTQAIREGVPGIVGIHLEGPFLATSRRGIHDAAHFRTMDLAAVDLLSRPTGGRTLVTLAPECVPTEFITALVERGVTVSLGHTDGTATKA